MITNPTNLEPILCLNQDKKAIEYALSKIQTAEPCSIVGMSHMSKEVIYKYLLQRLGKIKLPFILRELQASSDEQLSELLSEVTKLKEPILIVVLISDNVNSRPFIESINQLRLERSTNFVCVIISNIAQVQSSLEKNEKILFTSQFILKPLDLVDTNLLLADLQRRFKYILTPTQAENIIELSAGHIGLIKSLYLLTKDNPDIEYSVEKLIFIPSITFRLEAILNQLSIEKTHILLKNTRSAKDDSFFEQYGFTKNGEIFNELLKKYILLNFPQTKPVQKLENILTKSEMAVFEALLASVGKFVLRDEIAKIIWGESWSEKYSDWAIDMLISRVRGKLKKVGIASKIITKKGIGFYLEEG